MNSVALIDSDTCLFTVLSYVAPPLLPLRTVNKQFSERIEAFKIHRTEESKVSHEAVIHADEQSSQIYLKMRELIVNPKVNKKVSNQKVLMLYLESGGAYESGTAVLQQGHHRTEEITYD